MSDAVHLEPSGFFEALASFRGAFAWPSPEPAGEIPDLRDQAATTDLGLAMSLLFRTLLNAGAQLELGARAATLTAASAIHSDRMAVRVTPSVTTTTTTSTTSTTVPTVAQPVGSADAVENGEASGEAPGTGDATESNAELGPPSSLDVLSQDPEQAD